MVNSGLEWPGFEPVIYCTVVLRVNHGHAVEHIEVILFFESLDIDNSIKDVESNSV